MNFKTLHDSFKEKMVYLPVYLENKYDETNTETDHRKRAKALKTFEKRLNAITGDLNVMFDIQNSIRTALREIFVIDKITCNEVGLGALAKAYGVLGVHVERLQKFMKKNEKSLPEAVDFWNDSPFLKLNCFDMAAVHHDELVDVMNNGEKKTVNYDVSVPCNTPEMYKAGYKEEKAKLSN